MVFVLFLKKDLELLMNKDSKRGEAFYYDITTEAAMSFLTTYTSCPLCWQS